jgi:hypothetical protein
MRHVGSPIVAALVIIGARQRPPPRPPFAGRGQVHLDSPAIVSIVVWRPAGRKASSGHRHAQGGRNCRPMGGNRGRDDDDTAGPDAGQVNRRACLSSLI